MTTERNEKPLATQLMECEAWYRSKLATSNVPRHLHDGLIAYFVHQVRPGSFLNAVIENDLLEAVKAADATSAEHLVDVVRFLYRHAPYLAWGNPERVEVWIAARSDQHPGVVNVRLVPEVR